MKKNQKNILISVIVLSFISAVIPLIGSIPAILLIILLSSLKKSTSALNEKISSLEKDLEYNKLTKEEVQYLDINKEIKELENTINSKKGLINDLDTTINEKNSSIDSLNKVINENNDVLDKITVLNDLDKKIKNKKLELNELDQVEMYQSFGLYTPKYDLMDSNAYKNKLDEIRKEQKLMVKNKTATSHFDGWTLDGDKAKGRAMNNDNIKLIIRSFNNECDASIIKIKFNNIESIKSKINKSFDLLNKLGERNKISIKREYLNSKIKELELSYEYELKKQEEKEEQLRIREQMREEAKALKEIELLKKKLEKEKAHFENAIKEIELQLSNCNDDEKEKLLDKLAELNSSLTELEKDEKDIENREKNTRAGYVYIISNIGSFGDDVYKIGMTRRLEPNDRVRELGDASVPFQFDVHAMIFSDDAPALENALHKKFADKSVNKINMRKEFFRVSLNEIESEVKKNFNEIVEFTKIAEASDYRQTLQIEKQSKQIA